LMRLDGLYARLYSMQFRDLREVSVGAEASLELGQEERSLRGGRGELRDLREWDNGRVVVQQA
jgi:hypothetical protein